MENNTDRKQEGRLVERRWKCMGVYLNPGNDRFRRACNSEIYVDKTELITLTNKAINTEQNCICVSRPRRYRDYR